MTHVQKNRNFIILCLLAVVQSCGLFGYSGQKDSNILSADNETGVTYDTLGIPERGVQFIRKNTRNGYRYLLNKIPTDTIRKYFSKGGWYEYEDYGVAERQRIIVHHVGQGEGGMPFVFSKVASDTIKSYITLSPPAYYYELLPFLYFPDMNLLKIRNRHDMYIYSITPDTMICIEESKKYRIYKPEVTCNIHVYKHLSEENIKLWNMEHNREYKSRTE